MRKVILALLLLVAACGGTTAAASSTTTTTSATTTSTTTSTTTTTTTTLPTIRVDHDAGVAEIVGVPDRIAALSSVHVEMLYAMGAGGQLIAGDLFSTFPAEADELVKLDSFNLNVEEVIALEPDLVTLTFDPGGVVDALAAVGIPTLLLGTAQNLETAYAQIMTLGLATGNGDAADKLVDEISSGIARLVDENAEALEGITFYHETDSFTFYTPNSNSFIGELYTLLGMVNIADEAPDEFSSGFPQLSPEFIVDSDPFVIVLASFGETAETVAARDGWDAMTAVQEGRIVPIDTEAAGRWGPRVVDVLREIVEGVRAILP